LTKIASFHIKNTQPSHQSDLSDFDHDNLFLSMPISLSPDGSMIAATPANVEKDSFDAADRALFLVDIRRPTRRVTRIPFPKAPNTSPQPARIGR
jgi:hypothetical protein